jgi:hypothetical protein
MVRDVRCFALDNVDEKKSYLVIFKLNGQEMKFKADIDRGDLLNPKVKDWIVDEVSKSLKRLLTFM